MKKKLISTLLVLSMLVAGFGTPTAAAAGLGNFQRTQTYTIGQYTDIPAHHTFAENVRAGYEYGIMQGYGTTFGVGNNITRLASIIVACRLNCIYEQGQNSIESTYSGSTQEMYLQYAWEHGIFSEFEEYTAPATRAEFAMILNSALPDEALAAFNQVADNAIPDVPVSEPHADAVYRLYRAGILNGSDAKGTFYPKTNITRGAACAIATRMCDPALRKTVTLTEKAPALPGPRPEMTAETIYSACSPAVFYIEVSDSYGTAYASGSGFFIDSHGTAVTNYHVLENCASAEATMSDSGKVFRIEGVYDYDAQEDWAVIKVEGDGFPHLKKGAADSYQGGSTVYTIGSPLGLQNTIAQGLVSNPNRMDHGIRYIQTSAAMSHGSSGGALLNKYGEVIGITSASYAEGQNLNLALPITYIEQAETGRVMDFSEIFQTTPDIPQTPPATPEIRGYYEVPYVPDLGALVGVTPVMTEVNYRAPYTVYEYYYDLYQLNLADPVGGFVDVYWELLYNCGYAFVGDFTQDDITLYEFDNVTLGESVYLTIGPTLLGVAVNVLEY